ncbi:MAG: PQQ-dependent sugar dehydrogenase [Cytophagaceae bacterium]
MKKPITLNSKKTFFRNVFLSMATVIIFMQQSTAQVFPAGFSQVQLATGIANPTVMAFAPDGRIFICQQNGVVRIYKNGALLTTPALSLTVDSWFERGLLGIAFHPQFTTNNYIYLYYTVPGSPAHNRISRFTVNGDIITASSEVLILRLDDLNAGNHNGGAIHFGPDGKLYIATGENAVPSYAQNLTNHHGKILRINDDGTTPSDNPFFSNPSAAAKRIWAYGLRNPYTFTFHPTTGQLYINDVGANAWEEINVATTGGLNFGWPTTEGMFNQSTYPNFTNPVYAYGHDPSWNPNNDHIGCAIVGGVFYNPAVSVYPSQYIGRYFFMELCNSWINTLDASHTRAPFSKLMGGDILGLTLGNDGYLYYLHRAQGRVYRLNYSSNAEPVITMQPSPQTVSAGQPVSFSVSVSGAEPITYQWRKDGVNIPNSNTSTYTINSTVPGDAGQYSVYISNAHGNTTSVQVQLTVTAFNAKPVAQITSPANNTLFRAGNVISFSGEGTDEEDGTLPAANFKWFIVLHHNTHFHDGPAFATGVKSGTYTIPTVGETDHDIWYRLYLVVNDANGLTDTTYIELLPRKSTFTINTNPQGFTAVLDDQPISTPASVLSVVGMSRSLAVNNIQTLNGKTYLFDNWQHGGNASQTITVQDNNVTYTANYREVELDTIRLSPIHDAYVRDGASANITHGTTDPNILAIKNSGNPGDGFNRETFLTFDMSGITGTVTNARLRLYNIQNTETITAAVYPVTNTGWNENTITFANKPAASATMLDQQSIPANGINSYYSWTVSDYVTTVKEQEINLISFQLRNITVTAPQTWWNSKEAAQNRPLLEIVKVRDLPTTAKNTSMGRLNVYPNPATSFIFLELEAQTTGEALIKISTALSEEIRSLKYNISSGRNIFLLDTSDIPKGFYVMTIECGGEADTRRLVIH